MLTICRHRGRFLPHQIFAIFSRNLSAVPWHIRTAACAVARETIATTSSSTMCVRIGGCCRGKGRGGEWITDDLSTRTKQSISFDRTIKTFRYRLVASRSRTAHTFGAVDATNIFAVTTETRSTALNFQQKRLTAIETEIAYVIGITEFARSTNACVFRQRSDRWEIIRQSTGKLLSVKYTYFGVPIESTFKTDLSSCQVLSDRLLHCKILISSLPSYRPNNI